MQNQGRIAPALTRRSFDTLSNARRRYRRTKDSKFFIKFISRTANALPARLLRRHG